MSMIRNLPTTLWVVGATVAIAAFSPAVGQVATAPRVQPAAQPTQAAVQPTQALPSPTKVPAQPTKAPAQPSVQPTQAPVRRGVAVNVGETGLGPVATDAGGYTLYLSVLDSKDPSRSVCLSKTCLTAWLPVYLPKGAEPVPGPGVGRLGVLQRPDGTRQMTLGGWPLYRFSGDQAPGDVRGEGLKGTWHAIGPDGRRAAP